VAGPPAGADLGARIRAETERSARAGAAETRQAEVAAERLKEDLARQSERMGPAYMEMGLVEGTPGPSRRAASAEGVVARTAPKGRKAAARKQPAGAKGPAGPKKASPKPAKARRPSKP
jgi:hypothetical protein